jgi:uncharacterized membrane protein YccC
MIDHTRTTHGMLFALQITLSAVLVWVGLRAVGIPDPYWAVITVCVVAEPDFKQALNLSKVRVINTLMGCVVALIFLTLLGGSFWSMLAAVAITTLGVVTVEHYPANWRLAPATTVILMMAAPHSGLREQADLALLRAGEIAVGALTTLAVAWVQARCAQHWRLPAATGKAD